MAARTDGPIIPITQGSLMFNWDDLRSFLAVTRTESLSEAARSIGVNHTTVARRIQALEEGLEVRLFDKTPAGYILTDTGAQLLRLAEQVETTCISAQELVTAENPELAGTVRLSVPEGFGTHFLVKHLGEICEQYPRIELEIVALPQALSISKREADIAITLIEPSVGRLVVRSLTAYTLRIYGTRDYLQRSAPIERLQDLRSHRLISAIFSMPEFRFLDEILPDAGVSLRFKSINAQLAAVEAGLGMSLLPCYMAASSGRLTAVLPDEAKVTRTFWLSMHEDMRHVGRVAVVWDWLKRIVMTHQSVLLGNTPC
jgi:DNA-binding transcriptional LysR family regulator